MAVEGFYLPLLVISLISCCCSRLSEEFRKSSLGFRRRVLAPLTISLISIVLLAGWVIWFSYDQLIVRGQQSNPEMVSRGEEQIVFSLLVIAGCVLLLWKLIYRTSETGSEETDAEKLLNKSPASSCVKKIGIEIDEKLVLACSILLLPVIAIIVNALGAY
jgi:hypothetical protein